MVQIAEILLERGWNSRNKIRSGTTYFCVVSFYNIRTFFQQCLEDRVWCIFLIFEFWLLFNLSVLPHLWEIIIITVSVCIPIINIINNICKFARHLNKRTLCFESQKVYGWLININGWLFKCLTAKQKWEERERFFAGFCIFYHAWTGVSQTTSKVLVICNTTYRACLHDNCGHRNSRRTL